MAKAGYPRESANRMEAGTGSPENAAFSVEIVGRINELGAISETPEHLARFFVTSEHRAAAPVRPG